MILFFHFFTNEYNLLMLKKLKGVKMLKKFLCLLFFSTISLSVFADDSTFDAKVRYHADCPSKDYAKCARENNKEIIIKNMHGDSKIIDLKKDIFKHEKDNEKFLPAKQVITCENLWPDDNDYADRCWNDYLEGVLVDLYLRKN